MNISYDYYKTFYYVAKYKSISKAAAVLLCGQPNVTKAISNLEGQLGCALFLRSSRGVTLTPEGEKLYAHVEVACAHLLQAETELLQEQALESGVVSIGTTETALHSLLLPVVEAFHREHPKVKLRILSANTKDSMAALRSGTVDFCLVPTPVDLGKRFCRTPLLDFRERLCAGKDYRFLAEQTQSLSILEQYPIVSLGRDASTYEHYEKFLLEQQLRWHVDIEVSTAQQVLSVIRRGLGIGFLSDYFLHEVLKTGEVAEIPLEKQLPPRQICLVEDLSRPYSIACREIIRSVKSLPREEK